MARDSLCLRCFALWMRAWAITVTVPPSRFIHMPERLLLDVGVREYQGGGLCAWRNASAD